MEFIASLTEDLYEQSGTDGTILDCLRQALEEHSLWQREEEYPSVSEGRDHRERW
jgi:hypothetical protein